MKTRFNKVWLLISIVIIFNIYIFTIVSKKLENQVVQKMRNDYKTDLAKFNERQQTNNNSKN